ncbi:zeta toxin family protein [Owenweeksia hongkongensis]|uniref:zeta toxin family protein n=1 Tax=Owenweeksia hongkongensis TaxID=253245 RepID=UPI003A8D4541
MDNKDSPILTVIGGCNGSGKSSFSNALSATDIYSFDYDKVFLNIYQMLPDSELRDTMAHNKARSILEFEIENAIEQDTSFTYETNFNSTPLYWPARFKAKGYRLSMIFFCMNSLEEAKRRVQIRVENGGHFVPDWEIQKRYFQGFENLNTHWQFFDEVHLFDTSKYGEIPQHFLSLIGGDISNFKKFPDYLVRLLPNFPKKK